MHQADDMRNCKPCSTPSKEYRMKTLTRFSCLMAIMLLSSSFTLKSRKDMPVYIAGMSASFTDTVMYLTQIQAIDSVPLIQGKMLPGRQQYSQQLKRYLQDQLHLTDRTCFIYFDKKKNRLEKRLIKIQEKCQKGGTGIIHHIGDEFRFVRSTEEIE